MGSNISYKETTKQKGKSDKHKAEFKGKELVFYIIRVSHHHGLRGVSCTGVRQHSASSAS